MNVSMFGSGYVGLVTGACLSDVGHRVICVDIDDQKIQNLRRGTLPIFEPGLEEVVKRGADAGRLTFTTDVAAAVQQSQIVFIAVGTPSNEDGSADMRYVMNVAEAIGATLDHYTVVVTKSTVPVGTTEVVRKIITKILAQRKVDVSFDVVSNPEFLKEGAAIADFMKPDRIVIGSSSERAIQLMRELYEPFGRNHDKVKVMSEPSAELTKYAANALLATKISFMNELSGLAERVGADIEEIRKGIGSDPRIGYHFIYPGCGYGGSCFPKDVQALARMGERHGCSMSLAREVDAVNRRQKQVLFSKLVQHFGSELELRGKRIAIWGLAFKPNTDDMREAPSRALMERLWSAGASVRAFDPVALEECKRIYGSKREGLELATDQYSALDGADALVVCTEWQQFRAPDLADMSGRLLNKVIVDGRNLYDTQKLRAAGWVYYSVGRT